MLHIGGGAALRASPGLDHCFLLWSGTQKCLKNPFIKRYTICTFYNTNSGPIPWGASVAKGAIRHLWYWLEDITTDAGLMPIQCQPRSTPRRQHKLVSIKFYRCQLHTFLVGWDGIPGQREGQSGWWDRSLPGPIPHVSLHTQHGGPCLDADKITSTEANKPITHPVPLPGHFSFIPFLWGASGGCMVLVGSLYGLMGSSGLGCQKVY